MRANSLQTQAISIDNSELSFQNIITNNYIINGNFTVWQRGASQTTNGYGSADRWYFNLVGATANFGGSAWPVGDSTIPDMGEKFGYVNVTASSSASDLVLLGQKIEDVRTCQDQTVTISFWAYNNNSNPITVALYQNFGSGGSTQVTVDTQKITLTTGWVKYTLTFVIPSISGKTIGTGSFLYLAFWISAGSNYDASDENLGHQIGVTGFAQIKLEQGTSATRYIARPIQQELALCQRYYQQGDYRIQFSCHGPTFATTRTCVFPVAMRAQPTLSKTNTSTYAYTSSTVTGVDYSKFSIQVVGNSTTNALLYFDWTADAEL